MNQFTVRNKAAITSAGRATETRNKTTIMKRAASAIAVCNRNSTDSRLSMQCTNFFGATLNDAGAWTIFCFAFFLVPFPRLGPRVSVLMDNCRTRMPMRGILERIERVAAVGLAIRRCGNRLKALVDSTRRSENVTGYRWHYRSLPLLLFNHCTLQFQEIRDLRDI